MRKSVCGRFYPSISDLNLFRDSCMVRGLLFRDLDAFSTFREESFGLLAVQEILSEVFGNTRPSFELEAYAIKLLLKLERGSSDNERQLLNILI